MASNLAISSVMGQLLSGVLPSGRGPAVLEVRMRRLVHTYLVENSEVKSVISVMGFIVLTMERLWTECSISTAFAIWKKNQRQLPATSFQLSDRCLVWPHHRKRCPTLSPTKDPGVVVLVAGAHPVATASKVDIKKTLFNIWFLFWEVFLSCKQPQSSLDRYPLSQK